MPLTRSAPERWHELKYEENAIITVHQLKPETALKGAFYQEKSGCTYVPG